MIKLDYSLDTPEERLELVKKILEENPNPNAQYLQILADYLVFCMEKKEKRDKKILTENRLSTVNKREVSYEGLVSHFENGEDGVYNIVAEQDKNVIFHPKVSITPEDLRTIPELAQAEDAIAHWTKVFNKATGKEKYIAKRSIIDSRKDQYVIKNAIKPPVPTTKTVRSAHWIPLDDYTTIDSKGNVIGAGISLANPKVCSAILCNYSALREKSFGIFNTGVFYLLEEFDKISSIALRSHPMLEKIVIYKIDGVQNAEIQERLFEEFGVKHSLEYISSLWRKKIPRLIASAAEDAFLDWYYLNEEKGKYKKCSRCGKIKLAHNKYFSKNSTSKDGFYSICKECRNKKRRDKICQ